MSAAEILAELPLLTPAERDVVRARLDELAADAADGAPIDNLPFYGIWKDRTDLPPRLRRGGPRAATLGDEPERRCLARGPSR